MNKPEIRKKYKGLRNKLSNSEIETLSLDIANNTLKLPIWNFSFYHIFLNIVEHREVNTEYILNILAGKDKHIIIPKSNFNNNTLSHYLLTDSTLIKKNHWNIPEPINGIPISEAQMEVVFIPLLAYDKQGNRIGYGKGFYDNFLRNCNPETIKVGLSFFDPQEVISDIHNSDVPLDYCVTPRTSFKF